MSYPIEIKKIAAEAPLFQYNQTDTWQSLYQSRDSEDEIKQRLIFRAADQICHKFVGQLMKCAQIKTSHEPDGMATKVTCIALTYDELMDLLYRAYTDGQSDGMRRNFKVDL